MHSVVSKSTPYDGQSVIGVFDDPTSARAFAQEVWDADTRHYEDILIEEWNGSEMVRSTFVFHYDPASEHV
ncbi:hypothetical protein B7R21_06245 [Subtercola boreus]|uniref:Uncharacterized protein n=1 Tax=Subtercola boreus TaxID=120213 RepID=A0A3E0VWV1_9MICO|nr:hypothetical protein [Subtercola boreus]RFA14542.1 hypothetical protein B7R21_06245 [Subtercola boreus]